MIRLTRDEVWAIYIVLDDREEISDEILDFFFETHMGMGADEKIEISVKKVLDS